jgi:TldD protein
MTNTYFEPDPKGPNSLEECIEDVKEGVLIGHQSIPSIDSRRYRFQISAYEAWRIRKGEIAGMLKNTALMGTTPDYLGSIRTVGGPGTWELFQIPNCGKGDPMQIMRLANGGPVMVGTGRIIGGA